MKEQITNHFYYKGGIYPLRFQLFDNFYDSSNLMLNREGASVQQLID